MTWEIGLVLAILAGAVVLFASERYPIDLTAMLVLGSLLLFRLVSPEEGVSGFANPATVTVAAMFVLTAGLQKTGSVAFFGRLLVRFGRNRFFALLIVMLATAALSAFVNNTAAVAIFIPLVMTLSQRRRLAASKLLIPLSYASQFGGVCTLIGTSTNLLVSAISHGAGHGAFSMFELTRMGLVFFVAGTLYFLFLGQWLLPERAARQLSEQYGLGDFITELRVGAGSPLLGKTVLESRLGEEHDVTVLRLLHGAQKTWAPLRQPLQEGDVLLVRGGVKELMGLRGAAGLELNVEFKLRDDTLETEDQRLVQALVAPHSPLIGQTLKTIDFRARYKALVLAIQRRGVTLQEKLNRVRFELGDTLLIQAPRGEIERLRTDEAFIVLEGWEDGPGRRHKAPLALLILGTVVGLAAFDLMPILAAALLGVLALVLTRCLSTEEVYTAIDWQVIFLLAGVLPLGIALQKSGAALLIADTAVGLVGSRGPVAVLAVFYLLTAILTEFMSNNASAVLLAPIAITTAERMGIDPRPLLMAVTFAASTSFCTPIGYQTNAMIYNPGGYRYTDFLRAGLPLNFLFWLLAVYYIPRFWSF